MLVAFRWRDVAHTFDGYAEAGSFEACAATAREVIRSLDDGASLTAFSTEALRTTLFFLSRSDRHCGVERDSYPREESIVDELRRRNGDEWLTGEVQRLLVSESSSV